MTDRILSELLEAIEKREAVALVTVMQGEGIYSHLSGRRVVAWPDPERAFVGELDANDLGDLAEKTIAAVVATIEAKEHARIIVGEAPDRLTLFVEVQARSPHLIIVGAGHIAVPLASIGKSCDFEVSVLDDRPQYAHPARFPTADRVVAGPFRTELNRMRRGQDSFDDDTYIVLVTRGHQYDVDSLLEVIDDPLAYIGMIGSRRRIRAVFELLEREKGIHPSKFERVYAPIGLNIGAITPAEIAVCIMAEIINVMRGGPALGIGEEIRRERLVRRQRAEER